jgi:putative peptide zinc metalloprotease protein
MMITAGVTTVLFNANPLLRYDGYYILSDVIDLPNLYQRAQQMLTYLAEKHLFGVRGAPEVADSRRERGWLAAYGATSLAYRVIVFTGIVWVISGRFLIVGALIAVFCAAAWGLVPLIRFSHYLAASPRLERTRSRAIGVTSGLAAAALIVLFLIPAPQRLQATGVVQATAFADVTIGVDGQLERLETAGGATVAAGQPLARLRNGELVHEIEAARGQLEELEALWLDGLHQGSTGRDALEQGITAVRARVQDLEERQTKLVVTAPISGTWVAPSEDEMMGRWLTRGTALGSIVGPAGYEFLAVVPQASSSRLFANETTASHATVRLHGQADAAIPVSGLVVIQAEQTRLPSAALAQNAGGEIPLAKDAGREPIAAESFFEVRAAIRPQPGATPYQGLTGRISFPLPSEPLGLQWLRALRQIFQKRSIN